MAKISDQLQGIGFSRLHRISSQVFDGRVVLVGVVLVDKVEAHGGRLPRVRLLPTLLQLLEELRGGVRAWRPDLRQYSLVIGILDR